MTREEAIKILSTRDAHGVLCGYTSGVTEALDMAIEALKEKNQSDSLVRDDAENCKESESKLDLISRQDALCILKKKMIDRPLDSDRWVIRDIAVEIKLLPSAEPKTGECETCKRNADNGGFYDDGRTRCPIQEHYALLKDGYCHLYEPRMNGGEEE